jgi:uncharacterized repeat protein (TIGR03803 family)
MKILKHLPGLILVTAALVLSSVQLGAQPFATLHSFAPLMSNTNYDGANPYPALAVSGNTLYGSTFNGGANSNATIFSVNTDGTHFTNVYTFSVRTGLLHTNGDGAQCIGGVILSGNTLYGTTGAGGASGRGSIFAVNTDGSSFTNLHSFSGNGDGSATAAGLVLSGNTLYGACQSGGTNGLGLIFSINTDGSAYTKLHSFPITAGGINSEGAQPLASMVLSGNTLFGTTPSGGSGGRGSVYRINTDGNSFTNLHSFSALVGNTNSDGAQPFGGLTLSGNTLFGTTLYGGANSNGVLFKLNTDGSGYTNLHTFSALNNRTNSDGVNPYGALFLSGNTLYGTASAGGSVSNGTVFVLNTDGTGFRVLYNFSGLVNNANADGAGPVSGILWSNTLYGMTHNGGSGTNGTVFSLFVPPPLAIGAAATNAILAWPTNALGFALQSTTNLAPPVVWSNVLTAPMNINGQNTVTNPVPGGQMFYRLVR